MKDYRDGGTRGRVHTEDRLVFSAAVWLTYAELPISQFHPMQMTRDRTIATSDVLCTRPRGERKFRYRKRRASLPTRFRLRVFCVSNRGRDSFHAGRNARLGRYQKLRGILEFL